MTGPRYNQTRRKSLTLEEKDYILKSYHRYDGNPNLAYVSLRKSPDIIREIWKEAGLEVKERSIKSKKDLEKIVKE